jgi:hypothetical protein
MGGTIRPVRIQMDAFRYHDTPSRRLRQCVPIKRGLAPLCTSMLTAERAKGRPATQDHVEQIAGPVHRPCDAPALLDLNVFAVTPD